MAKTSIAVVCLLVAQAAAAFSGSDLKETIEAGRRVKDGHGRGADFQHSAFTTGFIAGFLSPLPTSIRKPAFLKKVILASTSL